MIFFVQDRAEDAGQQAEMKRRRDEEKGNFLVYRVSQTDWPIESLWKLRIFGFLGFNY